jgi:hypothetical protein
MKKTAKLKLSRETLRLLDASDLERAQGQASTVITGCSSVVPTGATCAHSCGGSCQIYICLTRTDYC